MIRAVCFNLDVFKPDVLQRIVEETGGEWMGYIGDSSQVNCIESFPDGALFYSYCWPDQRARMMDCNNDIQKFIYVNSYGKSNESSTGQRTVD